jgi:hypothetical protein
VKGEAVASFLKFLFGRGHDEPDAALAEPSEADELAGTPWFYQPSRNDEDRFPRFKSGTAAGPAERYESEEIARARIKLREAFTPSQPVTDKRLFAGRLQVLTHLIEAIEDRLAHVVVFGERGIGKTSLLHILSELAGESDYLTLRATCGAGTKFDVLFRTLLREIPIIYHSSVSPQDAGGESGSTLADLLPEWQFDARELSDLLSGITSCRVLIILDEYDRIESELFRINIAELIKNLSDRAAPVQLVIAGVSSNLHELIGYIPSIRRNVVGLPLPRLEHSEVAQIVEIGERASGLKFDEQVVALINDLSNGSPYLVRLVCYHSSLIALDHGRMAVLRPDVRDGLDQMVDEAAARLSHGALQRAGKLDWAGDVALLETVTHLAGTPSGWFSALDIAEQVRDPNECVGVERFIRNELIPMSLMEEEGSGVESRYRFVDEGLQSFLWITLARNRMARETA